jgi:predicted regulator of Ras-like GTPase activity (Roadblock/LC7/MglB family)
MFNTLKRFFGRRGEETVDAPEEYAQFSPPPGAAPVPRSQQRPAPARSVRVDAQPAPAARPPANAPSTLGVPLKSIIARLPADLMQRVRLLDVGEAEIFLPMQKVLSQISTGAVRLSFGELRQLAPPGTFTPENDRDRALVELPLHEVLARMNPGMLSRRPAQRHIEVPPEVTGPFGGQTKVTFSTAPLKPAQTARPAHAPAGQPPLRGQPPAAVPTQPMPRTQPFNVPAQPSPRIQPAGVPAGQPVFARIRPAAPVPQAPPVTPMAPVAHAPVEEALVAEESFSEAPVFTRNTPVAPQAPSRPVYSPIAPAQPQHDPSGDTEVIQMRDAFTKLPPAAPITPIAPVAEPEPAPIRFNNAPIRVQAPAPAPIAAPVEDAYSASSGETRFVNLSMAELSQSWPEALRQEITAKNLSGMLVGLPFGAVEGVIKTGKIAFPWKAIRAWLKAPVPAYVSAYDTTLLELPLKVITPLFLAELKATRSQRKVSMDEQIPDLFFDARVPEAVSSALSAPAPAPAPRPVAPPAAAPAARVPSAPPQSMPSFPAAPQTSNAKPADTNYFVWKQKNGQNEPVEDTEDSASDEPATPGTAFLNRYATPNEIVSKSAALEGVDGALIALPDGLLVASRIPPNMNADTIAAFLPQIFGRVSQCTRELRLGELNNLNFTVGNIPWKIFRVGAIYFAAFGRPGVPLPTAQLVGLAAELDRKAK